MVAALSAPVSSLRPLPFLSSPNPNPIKEPPLNLLLRLRPSPPPPPPPPPPSTQTSSFPTLAPKPRPPRTSVLPSASASSSAARGPVHCRAATGYAAALADAALCAGALGPAARCARRLALRADPAAAGAAAEGGLERHVAAMVRLLVGRGRAGMVAEVAAEFVRICDELGAAETVVSTVTEKKERRRRRRARHLFPV